MPFKELAAEGLTPMTAASCDLEAAYRTRHT